MASIIDTPGSKDSSTLQFYSEENWGLDFYFQTYNKMFVSDILSMSEYPMFPGAYMYKNHPVYKVDVVGVIVKVDQNSKCFMYEVDDGTGVVSCSCWKFSYSDKHYENVRNDMCKLPVELQRKFKSLDKTEEFSGYTLGCVIHVRGKISIFREKRQIVAANHQLVSDPMLEVFRMMELPKLYQMKYDKPFELPWKVAKKLMSKADENDLNTNDMKEVKTTLYGHLQSSDIVEVTAHVALKLESLEAIRNRLNSEMLHKCIEEVLISLEDDGFLCRRIENDKVFEVLRKDCDLEKTILHILKEECSKEKYIDKGCHYMHVIDILHRTYQYSHVKKQCVMYCLDKLELQSDIIRSTKCHYLPINYS
ncbi:CST complex subunit STN1-like [Mytilus californianus]|uniref:CST complex subunit STN1-like n=1 Tax=Mytilus californianus TaxID=6549 RepID=UPI002245A4A4|nr:CST complex subunit STN1-like [Mytilus californianus]